MDLTTDYLGLSLTSPFMVGASPLPTDLDMVKRLEDAGAAAIVMSSLFEEQIVEEQMSAYSATETPKDFYAEATSYFPEPDEFHFGPDEYLQQIGRIKAAVSCPVIASLNGSTIGGWTTYARQMADAGADALELNIYDPTVDLDVNGASIEDKLLEIVRGVRGEVDIPLAVKIAPFYTSIGNVARQIADAGADGLVLFNRLYQPDIDIESLELLRVNPLGLGDLPVRLRWLGILYGQIDASLACSGGVTTAEEAVKALMAGADVVQIVSAALLNGPEYLAHTRMKTAAWLEENEYDNLAQLRGSMSLHRCPDPAAYHRANYMKTLLSWRL